MSISYGKKRRTWVVNFFVLKLTFSFKTCPPYGLWLLLRLGRCMSHNERLFINICVYITLSSLKETESRRYSREWERESELYIGRCHWTPEQTFIMQFVFFTSCAHLIVKGSIYTKDSAALYRRIDKSLGN